MRRDWSCRPGFVDLHVHLREPGREEAETIETGSRAAALGGFTAVVAMPNTDPTQDSVEVVDFVRRQGERAGLCEVLPVGLDHGRSAGQQLTPFAELAGAGVKIFTDDGNGVQDPLLMRRALEYADGLGITLAQHCEVERLTEGAVMHEGACCSRLGLPGWPSIAEELMLHRDIELVRLTGVGMHFLHLSTAGSVELVRAAKADGLPITAEATPHHFSLTDELLETYDALYKVNPPLRTPDDLAAIRPGSPTARSTRSPPTTPRTRPRPRSSRSTRRRPGCSGSRRRSACRSPRSTWSSPTCSPRCRGSRRRSPVSVTVTVDRSNPASRRTSRSSTPTRCGRSCPPGWPARAATRPTSAWRCGAGVAHDLPGHAGRSRRGSATLMNEHAEE
jgi:hypothetical protein